MSFDEMEKYVRYGGKFYNKQEYERAKRSEVMTPSEVEETIGKLRAAYGWTGQLPQISREELFRLHQTALKGANGRQ